MSNAQFRTPRALLSAVVTAAVTVLCAARAAGSPSPDRARRIVRDVLDAREFRYDQAGRTWLDWLFELLVGWLDAVRDWFNALPGWVSWLIVIWMVATLIAILAHFVYVVATQSGRGSRRVASEQEHERLELYGIRELDFDTVYKRALRHLQGGDWRAAIRHLYVAAILHLDAAGRIHFRPSKTNRDYLNELGAQPDRDQFHRLTNTFENVVYGGQPADQPRSRTMAEILEQMREARR